MKVLGLCYLLLLILLVNTAIGQRDEKCRLNLDGGRCPTVTRYRYDMGTRRCVPFLYRGEGGNRNNFGTLQACRNRCENDSFLYVSLQIGR